MKIFISALVLLAGMNISIEPVKADIQIIYSSGYNSGSRTPIYSYPVYPVPYPVPVYPVQNAIPSSYNCPICIPPRYAVPNYGVNEPVYLDPRYRLPIYQQPVESPSVILDSRYIMPIYQQPYNQYYGNYRNLDRRGY